MDGVQAIRSTALPVIRRTTVMIFNGAFEQLLLNSDYSHSSLSADIEDSCRDGIQLLDELFDVTELKHRESIKQLIDYVQPMAQPQSIYFPHWFVNISEELLDQLDLIMMTHGHDLEELGLTPISTSKLILFLSTAGLLNLKLA